MVLNKKNIQQLLFSPWMIVAIALFFRLLYSFVILPHFFAGRDLESYGGYDRLAEQLVQGHGFTYSDGTINLQRLPLYIVFLAGHYAIFGVVRYPVLFSQALLGAFSAYLVWRLGGYLMADRHAKVAALIYALYPFAIWRNANLLADVIMVPLLLMTLLSIVNIMQNKCITRPWQYMFIGLQCALLTYTKPIAALLPIVFFALIMVCGGGARKNRYVGGIVLVCTYAVLLFPWVARNAVITGKFPVLSDGSGFVRYAGIAYADNFNFHEMSSRTLDAISIKQLGVLERQNGWILLQNPEMYSFKDDKEMSAYITRHYTVAEPLQTVRRYFQNLGFYWFLANDHWKSWLYLLIQVPFVLFAAASFLRRSSRKKIHQLLLGIVVLYFWCLNSLILGQVRYSDPVMPLILILAVSWWCYGAGDSFEKSQEAD